MNDILVTIHGSHLYGLDHDNSDRDMFVVTLAEGRKAVHTVTVDSDVVRIPLDRFLENVYTGSHQSVEALFSPVAWKDPVYRKMFDGIRVTGPDVFNKYLRTIKSFSHGELKKRRHAVRLAMNLRDLRWEGRFNPRMSAEEIETIKLMAERKSGDDLFAFCEHLSVSGRIK